MRIRGYSIEKDPTSCGYSVTVCNKHGKTLWVSPVYPTLDKVYRILAAKYQGCLLYNIGEGM